MNKFNLRITTVAVALALMSQTISPAFAAVAHEARVKPTFQSFSQNVGKTTRLSVKQLVGRAESRAQAAAEQKALNEQSAEVKATTTWKQRNYPNGVMAPIKTGAKISAALMATGGAGGAMIAGPVASGNAVIALGTAVKSLPTFASLASSLGSSSAVTGGGAWASAAGKLLAANASHIITGTTAAGAGTGVTWMLMREHKQSVADLHAKVGALEAAAAAPAPVAAVAEAPAAPAAAPAPEAKKPLFGGLFNVFRRSDKAADAPSAPAAPEAKVDASAQAAGAAVPPALPQAAPKGFFKRSWERASELASAAGRRIWNGVMWVTTPARKAWVATAKFFGSRNKAQPNEAHQGLPGEVEGEVVPGMGQQLKALFNLNIKQGLQDAREIGYARAVERANKEMYKLDVAGRIALIKLEKSPKEKIEKALKPISDRLQATFKSLQETHLAHFLRSKMDLIPAALRPESIAKDAKLILSPAEFTDAFNKHLVEAGITAPGEGVLRAQLARNEQGQLVIVGQLKNKLKFLFAQDPAGLRAEGSASKDSFVLGDELNDSLLAGKLLFFQAGKVVSMQLEELKSHNIAEAAHNVGVERFKQLEEEEKALIKNAPSWFSLPAKRKAAQAAWETLEAEINKVWDQVGPRLQAEHRQMQQQMQAAQPANAS